MDEAAEKFNGSPDQDPGDSSPDLLTVTTDELTNINSNQYLTDSSSSSSRAKNLRIISIIDLDPHKICSIPAINEQESCLAMSRLGIEPEDLVKLSKESISKIPGTPEMQNNVASELEKRRLDTIENIVKERQRIINEQNASKNSENNKEAKSKSSTQNSINNLNNSLEIHKNRFEKLKKTQLINILKQQQQRKTIAEEDIVIQNRIKETKERRQQEIQLRKSQEEEKTRQQIEKKQEIEQSQLEKKLQEEEKRKNYQTTNQRFNDQRKQQIQQQRNQKLQQILTQQKQRQIEEQEKAEKKLQFVQNRQNLIDKKRAQILNNLQNKARENDKKIETKMQILKQREEQKRIENEEKLRKRSETSRILVSNEQMLKLNQVNQRRLKEKEKIEAARKRSLSKSSEIIEEMKKEMCKKQLKAEENMKFISLSRKMRYIENNNKMNQRSISAIQTKKEKEEKFRADFSSSFQQKQENAQKRAEIIREMNIKRIQEKASNAYLKQKIGEEKARRIERIKQFEVLDKAEREKEKIDRISDWKKKQRDDQAKELAILRKNEQFELEQIERFQNAILNKPDADIMEVAKSFGIDLSEFADLIQKDDQEKKIESTQNSVEVPNSSIKQGEKESLDKSEPMNQINNSAETESVDSVAENEEKGDE